MTITLLLASAAAWALSPEGHDHSAQLGKVKFPTSCNTQAQALVEQGLGWLHSFEYGQAETVFAQAVAADPSCAIAHWGMAKTYYHPLWAPPSAAELEKGRIAVTKAQAAGAKSQREQDYIAALDAFYRDSDQTDHKSRALAYNAAMADLHRRYPDDREAAAFYALTLVATGTLDDDPEFAREKQAAAILNAILEQSPDHPGVAHYLIHSFDYPPLAQLAVPAAQRYASIAPASPHAQHMPSHIFTRLGMWDESIQSNIQSEAASREMAKVQGLAGSSSERLHAMDYLAYAYLQTGQDLEAERIFSELNAIEQADPPTFAVAYAATAIPARLALERRRWSEAASLQVQENVLKLAPLENFRWAEAHIQFARAVGAARSGDAAAARAAHEELTAIEQALTVPPGSYDWRKQVMIERQIAEAWLAHAEGRKDEALRLMRTAADLDDATEKHPVTPGSILPAREQLGELLLELGRPGEALEAYEASLNRAPRRLAGLYGAARSAKLAGDSATSGRYFSELSALTKASDGTRAEIAEARSAAESLARR